MTRTLQNLRFQSIKCYKDISQPLGFGQHAFFHFLFCYFQSPSYSSIFHYMVIQILYISFYAFILLILLSKVNETQLILRLIRPVSTGFLYCRFRSKLPEFPVEKSFCISQSLASNLKQNINISQLEHTILVFHSLSTCSSYSFISLLLNLF